MTFKRSKIVQFLLLLKTDTPNPTSSFSPILLGFRPPNSLNAIFRPRTFWSSLWCTDSTKSGVPGPQPPKRPIKKYFWKHELNGIVKYGSSLVTSSSFTFTSHKLDYVVEDSAPHNPLKQMDEDDSNSFILNSCEQSAVNEFQQTIKIKKTISKLMMLHSALI